VPATAERAPLAIAALRHAPVRHGSKWVVRRAAHAYLEMDGGRR
jgi:hypothetical protein